MLRKARGWAPRLAICAVVSLGMATGCAEQNGVLEIDSGSPIRQATVSGGGSPTYAMHVGECATMRFRAKIGTCDYALMHDESSDQYVDCGPCMNKQFEWKYMIGESAPTEQPIRLTVAGYLQRGSRDRMPMGGELVDAGRPNDDWDYKLAQASALVKAYQSVVEIPVTLPKGRPDWALTKLIITRADGQQTRVSLGTADARGFHVTGPDDAAIWRVRYEPRASEVNCAGETSAVLQVADEQGQITSFRQSFATP